MSSATTAAPLPGSAPPPFSHSDAFRLRRFLNWFPLGLAYAFLYMGRYNLAVAKTELGQLMTKEDFGVIFGVGTLVYGVVFLLNGPLTDKIGGKRAMLIAIAGTALSNLLLGFAILWATSGGHKVANLRLMFCVLYGANMYFQSFGAVAIVKVNAHWFHVRERGGFSGIFGTMISSGIFLAFTVNKWMIELARGDGPASATNAVWAFFGPTALLVVIFAVELFLLKDRPSETGHKDFDTGDASSGDDGQDVSLRTVMRRIVTNPIILTVAFIELCTGVLRQGIMQWYPIYADEVLALPGSHALRYGSWGSAWLVAAFFVIAAAFFVLAKRASGRRKGVLYVSGALVFLAPFFQGGWGGLLFVAGVIGGNVAGWVSDLFFQSRRAPAAGGLYLGLAVSALFMYFVLGGTTTNVGWANTDKAAHAAGLDQLERGDVVLSIAGRARLASWHDVSRAVACFPAECARGAGFDTTKCMCTSAAKGADATPPTDGVIPARVRRGGQELSLRLRDPAVKRDAKTQALTWSMRAGDARKIQAGPVLTLSPLWLGLVMFLVSTCVIGTHGLLSGTATMDFGGRKGAATAVGMIDGFVYLGSSIQAFALGYLTTQSWSYWPLFLLPFAAVGFVLTTRIWHAKPRGAAGH